MSIKLEYLGVLNQINLQNRFALKYQNDYFVFAHLLGDSRDLHGRFARPLGPARPGPALGRSGPGLVEPGSGPKKTGWTGVRPKKISNVFIFSFGYWDNFTNLCNIMLIIKKICAHSARIIFSFYNYLQSVRINVPNFHFDIFSKSSNHAYYSFLHLQILLGYKMLMEIS